MAAPLALASQMPESSTIDARRVIEDYNEFQQNAVAPNHKRARSSSAVRELDKTGNNSTAAAQPVVQHTI